MKAKREMLRWLCLFGAVVLFGCNKSKPVLSPVSKASFTVSKLFDCDLMAIVKQYAVENGMDTGVSASDRNVISDTGKTKIMESGAKRTVSVSLNKVTPGSTEKLLQSFREELTKRAQVENLKIEVEVEKVQTLASNVFHMAYKTDHKTRGKLIATLDQSKELDASSGTAVIKTASTNCCLLIIEQTELAQ